MRAFTSVELVLTLRARSCWLKLCIGVVICTGTVATTAVQALQLRLATQLAQSLDRRFWLLAPAPAQALFARSMHGLLR